MIKPSQDPDSQNPDKSISLELEFPYKQSPLPSDHNNRSSNHSHHNDSIKDTILTLDSKQNQSWELPYDAENQTLKQCITKKHQVHRVINYRADIDGIRAVAIIFVLIYHAFPTRITGGFIGVDVFFVISGFLITQIIIKEITQQKFSIINFYVRRIKRIYPALIVVLCFALWVIKDFSAMDLAKFSLETLEAALIFCSNLRILLHKQDYFDADVRGNPLLHLWSLGVEEQFYIVWPFLLVMIFRYWKKNLMKIMTSFTILSFIFSIICVYNSTKFAFYFPLCRFWQMAVGGILGSIDLQVRNPLINNILSMLGLGAIVITSFVITDESLFPGFLALLPTLGCALVIQAKNQAFINKYILSSRPFTFVGQISYSLYLWHWVLIVFSRVYYPYGSKSLFSSMLFIVFLSFVLSILTFYILEDPVRKIRTQKVAILLLVLMAFVGLGAHFVDQYMKNREAMRDQSEMEKLARQLNTVMIPSQDDFVMINGRMQPNLSVNKKRLLPTNISQVLDSKIDEDHTYHHGGDSILEKNIDDSSPYGQTVMDFRTQGNTVFSVANEGRENQLFVIGDSHAQKISHRFDELFRRSQMKGTLDKFPTIVLATIRGLKMGEENKLLNITRKLVATHKPKRILLVWNWMVYFCYYMQRPMEQIGDCCVDTAKRYLEQFTKFALEFQNQGIQVFTNGVDINYIQYKPSNMYDSDGIITQNLKPFKYSEFRGRYWQLYAAIEGGLTQAKLNWTDTTQSLCFEDSCEVTSPKGYAVFLDIDHMGRFFSRHWFGLFDHLVEF